MLYSEKLKNPKWQKKRLQILQRDKWTCQLCGDIETELHVHHSKYTGEPWNAPDEDLISYCKHCHFAAESINFRDDGYLYKVMKYSVYEENDTIDLLVCIIKNDENLFGIQILTYSDNDNNFKSIGMNCNVIHDLNKELNKIRKQLKNKPSNQLNNAE